MSRLAPVAALLLAALPADAAERLMRVEEIMVMATRSLPPIYWIAVKASASTPGWRNVTLRPLKGAVAPPDGLFTYELVGEPPRGMVAQVVTPLTVQGRDQFRAGNYWGKGRPLKGFRVIARQNEVIQPLQEETR